MIAKNIKRGMIMVYEGNPVIIESIFVQTPSARGASTLYKFRARNLLNKQKVDFTFKGDENMNEADFGKRNVHFSYSDSEKMYFMDDENFEMYELPFSDVEDEKPYITDHVFPQFPDSCLNKASTFDPMVIQRCCIEHPLPVLFLVSFLFIRRK